MVVAGGVEFECDERMLVQANIALRTSGRVLIRVAEFKARTFPELERHGARIPWERFVARGGAHFRVTTKKSRLYHERGIAERLAVTLLERCPGTAVVEARGEADVEEHEVTELPTIQRFVVRFHRDTCTISADSSGPLLHRRGYRLDGAKAPLRETLAASLLLATGWDGTTPLIDPLCGSGTIPIEAAMMARRIPPGLTRRFSFERWPAIPTSLVESIREEYAAAIRPTAAAAIAGSDRDAGAIHSATANAQRAGVGSDISWRRGAISSLVPGVEGGGWIITNPPYGARVGERKALRDLYAQIGNVLRRSCPGWRIAMISADRMLEAQVGMEWRELASIENGGLNVRFVAGDVPLE